MFRYAHSPHRTAAPAPSASLATTAAAPAPQATGLPRYLQALPMPAPGDASEVAADHTAVAVAQGRPAGLGQPAGSRSAGTAHRTATPSPLPGPGQPLDAGLRTHLEPAFGQELGDVRLHTGRAAAHSARALHAQAYTVGSHIAFAAGRYAPATPAGRHLLAHELAHVTQQRAGPVQLQRAPDPTPGTDTDSEDAAEDAGTPVRVPHSLGPMGNEWLPPDSRRMADELQAALDEMDAKKAREAAEKARQEAEDAETTHTNLMILRPMLVQHGFRKQEIIDLLLATRPSGMRALQIVRHYGCEPPGFWTKRATYQNCVVDALNKYDYDYRAEHGQSNGPSMRALTDADLAAMRRQELLKLQIEGMSAMTGSFMGAAFGYGASLFTDDPATIVAWAQLGNTVSGIIGPAAQMAGQRNTYTPSVVDNRPADPWGDWRYTGPQPTTPATPTANMAPAPAPAPLPTPASNTPAPANTGPANTAQAKTVSPPAPVNPAPAPDPALAPTPKGQRRIVTVGGGGGGGTGNGGGGPAPGPGQAGLRQGPLSPLEERIRVVSGQANIYVGMQARIEVTGDAASAGLGGAGFAGFDMQRAAALGGSGRAAVLPDVRMPPGTPARRGSQRSAGLIVEPGQGARSVEVLAWNTGDPVGGSNVSHAERQFIEWFRGLDTTYKARVTSVTVNIFGRDVCTNCNADLQALRQAYPNIQFNWVRADTGRPYRP